MKKTILILLVSLLGFSSCDKTPDDIIYNTKTEDAGWVVKEKGDKPTMSQDTYYQISPTWGQSIHYAKGSPGFGLSITLGIILLLGAIVLFYAKATDASWLPESLDSKAIYIIFVLVLAGSYALYSKSGDVRWNNDKWVKKEVYDKAIKESGSTQPIWDSLENNHLIIGGSWK